MEYLATLYRAAQLYAHNAHNLAHGPTFFEDHEFLGELYGTYESAYDDLIERLIGLGSPPDLLSIQTEAVNVLNSWGPCPDQQQCFAKLLELEGRFVAEIERIEDEYSAGTQNLLEGLADESEKRAYKLKQRLN